MYLVCIWIFLLALVSITVQDETLRRAVDKYKGKKWKKIGIFSLFHFLGLFPVKLGSISVATHFIRLVLFH